MWAPILLPQLRPQRLHRSPTNTSIKTLAMLGFVPVFACGTVLCSAFKVEGSRMSTKDISPIGGKATHSGAAYPEERPFRFGIVALPALKGK